MKTALGEAGLRALLNNLQTQLDTKVDLDDGKVASSQMPDVSWNDLKDRPFDEDATIPGYEYTWPTDTTGLATVSAGASFIMYRVGDALTADALLGATMTFGQYTDGVLTGTESVVLSDDDVDPDDGIVLALYAVSVLRDGLTYQGITFEHAGLYLCVSIDGNTEVRCDSLIRAAVDYKTKLSYNDLADRPCGDTENDDGYEYALPADTSDAESFDVTMDGTTITLYWIGDALTAEQLAGAVMRITFTITQNGDTQDMSEEMTIKSTDLSVETGYIEVEGCIVSILSDNVTYSDVSVPHAGMYAVYIDADFEDGGVSYHVLQRLDSLARANTVMTKQLDEKYIPTLSASKVPSLSNLNGTLTAGQVPNLESLNGAVTASQVPKLSDLNGTLDASQVVGLSNSWADLTNKPFGMLYQYTDAMIDYNTVRTVPANDGTGEYIRYYSVGDANQYVEIESLVGAQCSIDLSYDNNGMATSFSYPNVQSYDSDTTYGFGAMYIVSQDDMEMLYVHGTCNDRPIFLLCPQMTYHGIMMGSGLWVAEYAPLFTLTKSGVFSDVRYGRRLKPQTWDDITDRPFGGTINVDEYEIYGNRTSSSALVETTDGEQYTYFRLGNSMSLNDLLHARLQASHGTITALQNIGMWLTLHNCASHTDGTSDWVEVSNPKGTTLPLLISTGSDSLTLYGGTFTDGLWAIGTASGSGGGYYSLTRKCTVTQKLDTAYLPDGVKQVPMVTSSDNGKVLRVVNGAWAAVSLPSASGVSF